jgi:hypothetical protein
MNKDFTFAIKRSCFDTHYNPAENTRITTNFANLARGDNREENLRNTLTMIDNRFNRWRTGITRKAIVILSNWKLFQLK